MQSMHMLHVVLSRHNLIQLVAHDAQSKFYFSLSNDHFLVTYDQYPATLSIEGLFEVACRLFRRIQSVDALGPSRCALGLICTWKNHYSDFQETV